ncbi:hypothetical protein QJS04_geneDACA024838 [Acorus gramineus]|uniref:Ribosomal protein L2 n=1 Tax=Acorus gramineus TaxID=55184 RepID=A0AAV9AZ39_ACOGR|nr:hypothetical protein QJS04_geneDACA024838 [Acorus gramineus]
MFMFIIHPQKSPRLERKKSPRFTIPITMECYTKPLRDLSIGKGDRHREGPSGRTIGVGRVGGVGR